MNYLFIVLVCLVASYNFLLVADDLYFILATGRYITLHGIFYEDVLTMHEGLVFQAEQWLTSVMYWNIYDNFGVFGLSLVISLFFCLTGILYYKLYGYYGGKGLFFPVVVLLVLGLNYATARPQTVSMFFCLLFLYSLEMARKSKKWYGVSLLCSTAVANFHGGIWFILLLVIMTFFAQFYKEWKEYALLLVGVVLAGSLNPYGFNMLGFAGGSLTEGYHAKMAMEMCPASFVVNNEIFQPGLFIIISIGLLFYVYKKAELRHILLFAGFWVVSMTAMRGFLQLLLLGFPAMIALIEKDWDEYLFIIPVFWIIRTIRILAFQGLWCFYYNLFYYVVGIVLVFMLRKFIWKKTVVLFMLCLLLVRPVYCSFDNQFKQPDVIKAMTKYPNGTVYTIHGSVMEFFGYKPYIDMRLELYSKAKNKKKDIIKEYLDVRSGKLYFPDFVEKYKFDYILTEKGELEYTYMKDVQGYRLIYQDENLKLFEKMP